MDHKILEIEHRPGDELVLHIHAPKKDWFPPETREHLWTARREFLLALRSLVDEAIGQVEEREKKKRGKSRTKIDVQ